MFTLANCSKQFVIVWDGVFVCLSFPGGSVVKNQLANAGDVGSALRESPCMLFVAFPLLLLIFFFVFNFC